MQYLELRQEWLPPNTSLKRPKRTLFIMTKHNMRIERYLLRQNTTLYANWTLFIMTKHNMPQIES